MKEWDYRSAAPPVGTVRGASRAAGADIIAPLRRAAAPTGCTTPYGVHNSTPAAAGSPTPSLYVEADLMLSRSSRTKSCCPTSAAQHSGVVSVDEVGGNDGRVAGPPHDMTRIGGRIERRQQAQPRLAQRRQVQSAGEASAASEVERMAPAPPVGRGEQGSCAST